MGFVSPLAATKNEESDRPHMVYFNDCILYSCTTIVGAVLYALCYMDNKQGTALYRYCAVLVQHNIHPLSIHLVFFSLSLLSLSLRMHTIL